MNADDGCRLYRHERAKEDIAELYAYLLQRNESAARRFLADLRKAFDLIVTFPTVGRAWESPHSALAGVRYTTVSRRFRNYLIFYRPAPNSVTILTVLHAARDLRPFLDALADDDLSDGETTSRRNFPKSFP